MLTEVRELSQSEVVRMRRGWKSKYFVFTKGNPRERDFNLLMKYYKKYDCFIATYMNDNVLRGIIRFPLKTTIYSAAGHLPGFALKFPEDVRNVIDFVKKQPDCRFYREHPMDDLKRELFR
jgi:hypothetical protein